MKERPLLAAIVGPTAVGKSTLALELCQRLTGEIISADSRQVYRYMDIGTAKPTPRERAVAPHHMIDIADPDEPYSVALYRNAAITVLQQVFSRGKLPILVGGTGLWVTAITRDLALPQVPPDPTYRQEMEKKARREGVEAVWGDLYQIDPAAAERIGQRNLRRMIRALEVWRATGVPFSKQASSAEAPWDTLTIGLTMDRARLYERIDQRVDCMMEQGLLEEVQRLVETGYGWDLSSMSGLGYKQIGEYMRGERSLEEAVQRIKYQTHRYARQQYTWFRLDDPNIRWFDVQKNSIIEESFEYLQQALESQADNRG